MRYYVDTVFMFGAQKGAIGAIVDKSGTPFDQAELMVALLRQAAINDPVNHNYTASYKLGTITLTAAQFSAWTNITNAQAACDLLASGGIPGTVNGLTAPMLCSSIGTTTSVSTVTLEHIWVEVVIGGTHYVFDPSYKNYTFTTGVNLATAAALTTGQAMTAATTGYTSGNDSTYPSVGYVKNLNATSLSTQLATYAGNIQNYIQTQSNPSTVPLASARIINLVGGREITPCATPCTQVRQTTLPYTSSATRTWTGNVPDQFRASMAITLTKANSVGTFDTTINNLVLFADDIYGRKLIYDTSFVNQAPTSFTGSLEVVDEFGNATTLSTYGSGDNPGYSVGTITIVVNHPYVADANGSLSPLGTYMDTTVSRPVRYSTPFTIVHGWGEANRGLIDKWASRPNTTLPANIPPNGCDYTCTSGHRGNKGDANREQLAALWLVQSSKAARLHASIANAVYTHHHTIGIVGGDSEVATTNLNPPGPPPNYRYSIAENFDRIDADTGFSVISTTADPVARRVAIHSIAATMEALEGSTSAQQSDLPDTVSTATRFEWGNAPPSAEDPSGYGARRFFDLTSSNVSNLTSLLLVEGVKSTTQTGVHGGTNPIIGQLEVQARQNAVNSILTGYTGAGFRVISSEEAFLGPGQRGGSFILQSGTQYVHRYSHQRGGAFVATRYDTNALDPLEIAHVAVNVNQDGTVIYGIKGGGAGTQADQQSNYDPAMAADILKGQFVDKSEVLGVDLLTGGLTYTSPASLTVGNGKFPYSLSANLTWRGGVQQDQVFGNVSHVAPNTPWTTNWNSTLTISGSALEAMGENDIRAAAGTVAAFLAMQDVYKSAVSAQREVAAVLVGSWWTHQITGNVASASVGTETRQFLQKTDPTTHALTWFAAGPKGFATLAQTGQRAIYTEPNCASGGAPYVLTRGWDYSGVSFVVTNANGDQQNFSFWDNTYSNGGSFCAFLHGFRLSSWTFPYGMSINLSYAPDGNGLDQLTQVSNTFGRKIVFANSGYGGFSNGLTGANLQSVSAVDTPTGNFPTTSTHTDPAGAVTTVNHSLTGYRYLLTNVFTADSSTLPALAYTYDTLNRVRTAKDAEALRVGDRNPYTFYIGEGVRGDRIDPAGGNFSVLYDIYRRPMQYYDELNNMTAVTHDGRGRVTGYKYPELNRQTFTYDDHNNTTSLTRIGKTGVSLPPIQAVWDQTWNSPTSITDAMGCQTVFVYYGTNPGMSLMQTATRCKPDSTQLNPVYAFTYNSYGQTLTSTDPTSVKISNTYDTVANGGNLLSSVLDPTGIDAITSFAYDSVGNTTSVTDQRSNVIENQYDADRRKTVTLHHNGLITAAIVAAEKTIYDVLGRDQEDDGCTVVMVGPTCTTWQMLKQTSYTPTGKVHTVTDGAGDITTYAYDPMDRPNLVTDPVNRRVATVYDYAGNTTCIWRAWNTASAPTVCPAWSPSSYSGTGPFQYGAYTYSANGKQKATTDANNNTTLLVYDVLDRLSAVQYPMPTIGSLAANPADSEIYSYDNNDNRLSVQKRDLQTINYVYDALNRQTEKHPPGATSGYTYSGYDLAGRPTFAYYGSKTSGTGTSYAYDSAGRMHTETQYGRTMTYGHDLANNRTQTTWPDGNWINYDFDAMNRNYQIRENGATSGAGVLASYVYDWHSRKQTLTRGNGTVSSYGYDPASRLTSLGQDIAGSAQDVAITYQYTLASQLYTRASNNALYDWSPTGASSTSYVPDGLNRYATVGGTAYGYSDARGNLTSDGTNTYSYDVENRLLTASGPTAVTMTYDPLGRLQSTTSAATVTQYLYSGTELVGELDGSGNVLRRYVHGPGTDDPIVWYEGSTLAIRNYLHGDERGSTIATTDNTGAGTIYSYGPYGEPIPGWTGSRFRYTGQTAIPEAQLYYYKARIYSPTIGRFLQTDPVGTRDDLNLYAYVGNDPTDKADPTGLGALDGLINPSTFPSGSGALNQIADALDFADANYFTPLGPFGGVEEHIAEVPLVFALRGLASATKVTSAELRAAGRADFAASKAAAIAENGGKCVYCNSAAATHGDHIKSLKASADEVNAGKITKEEAVKAANAPANIAGACPECNLAKGASELSETPGPGKFVPSNPSDRIKQITSGAAPSAASHCAVGASCSSGTSVVFIN